jgi:hypothetical protein
MLQAVVTVRSEEELDHAIGETPVEDLRVFTRNVFISVYGTLDWRDLTRYRFDIEKEFNSELLTDLEGCVEDLGLKVGKQYRDGKTADVAARRRALRSTTQ